MCGGRYPEPKFPQFFWPRQQNASPQNELANFPGWLVVDLDFKEQEVVIARGGRGRGDGIRSGRFPEDGRTARGRRGLRNEWEDEKQDADFQAPFFYLRSKIMALKQTSPAVL